MVWVETQIPQSAVMRRERPPWMWDRDSLGLRPRVRMRAAPPSPGPSLPPSPHPSCSLHPPRGLQGLEMFGQLPVLWLSSCDLASLLAAGNLGMDQAM